MLPPLWNREAITDPLVSAHLNHTVPSTLLLHGSTGVGKRRLALWLGKLLLCRAPSVAGPCDDCASCRLAERLEHPDLHWFFPLPRPKGTSGPDRLRAALETARHERLAELRGNLLAPPTQDEPRGLYLGIVQTIRKMAQSRPSMADTQIFIVSEAEYLVPQEASPEAANALLKLLEEPPGNTRFILTTQVLGAVLDTIRSRCTLLHVPPLPEEEVANFLTSVGDAIGAVEEENALRAARLSRGSIGRALGFLARSDGELGPLEGLRQESFRVLRAVVSEAEGGEFSVALGYPAFNARGLVGLFGHLEDWFRDLAAAAAEEPDAIQNRDATDYLTRIARERGVQPWAVLDAIHEIQRARDLAAGNVNPQLVVSGLIARLRELLTDAVPAS